MLISTSFTLLLATLAIAAPTPPNEPRCCGPGSGKYQPWQYGGGNHAITKALENSKVFKPEGVRNRLMNTTFNSFASAGEVPPAADDPATASNETEVLPGLVKGELPATAMFGAAGGDPQVGPEIGTNEDAPTAGNGQAQGFGFTDNGIDYEARLADQTAQPELPVPKTEPADRCEYAYAPVLGSMSTTPVGDLWALEGYVDLVSGDIKQGSIGDCGLGASVMAMTTGGWTKYLKRMFIKLYDRPNVGDRSMAAAFKRDGKTQLTLIDDQLPTLQNANANCWKYLGFQPVQDAAKPAADGSYPPTDIFFMPLLEKAMAKFLDNNPDWKNDKKGYSGLTGILPAYALAALTGGTPKTVWRTQPGFDPAIIAATLMCMRGDVPCAVDTGSVELEGLGTKSPEGAIWLTPGGSTSYVPGSTAGIVANDKPSNNKTFSVIDFDQLDANGRSKIVTLVGLHAYAFDTYRSSKIPFFKLEDARIRLINPWGLNPPQKVGGDGRGVYGSPAEVTLSLRAFLMVVRGIFTVENMPAF